MPLLSPPVPAFVSGVPAPLGAVAGPAFAAAVAFAVHVLGHYYAARRIVGIPAASVTIDVRRFPQHVALRDEDVWVTTRESERFRAAYRAYDPDLEHFERFVAGGDIVQTALVVPAALGATAAGFPAVAGAAVVGSLLTTALLVALDVVMTQFRAGAAGDYSTLWTIEWRVPVLILLGVVLVHLGVFWFVA